jgi:hypothetical protein
VSFKYLPLLLTGVVNTLLIRLTSDRFKDSNNPSGVEFTLPGGRKALLSFSLGEDIPKIAKIIIDGGGNITRIGDH